MIHASWLVLLGATVSLSAATSFDLISTNAAWRLFKGRTEASTPDLGAWRTNGFNDATFTNAQAPFTYGEGYTNGTVLSDMLNSYGCIFLRGTFVVTNTATLAGLRLGAKVDDGFVAWVNGVEAQRMNMNEPAGSPVTITNLAVNATEPVPFVFYDLGLPPGTVQVGTNLLAIQVFNTSLGSSDLVFDASLTAVLLDNNSPVIVSVNPPPGMLTSLTNITVTFSEPVNGVGPEDLLVNMFITTANANFVLASNGARFKSRGQVGVTTW